MMSSLMTEDEINRWLVFASWACVPQHGEVHTSDHELIFCTLSEREHEGLVFICPQRHLRIRIHLINVSGLN